MLGMKCLTPSPLGTLWIPTLARPCPSSLSTELMPMEGSVFSDSSTQTCPAGPSSPLALTCICDGLTYITLFFFLMCVYVCCSEYVSVFMSVCGCVWVYAWCVDEWVWVCWVSVVCTWVCVSMYIWCVPECVYMVYGVYYVSVYVVVHECVYIVWYVHAYMVCGGICVLWCIH